MLTESQPPLQNSGSKMLFPPDIATADDDWTIYGITNLINERPYNPALIRLLNSLPIYSHLYHLHQSEIQTHSMVIVAQTQIAAA